MSRTVVRRVLLATFVLVVLGAAAGWFRTQIRMDDCLDGGGRWDHEPAVCEGAR